MSYKVFIFIVVVVVILCYFLLSFFAPIGSTVVSKGMVIGQNVSREPDGDRSVWLLTLNKGIVKVTYATAKVCSTDLGSSLQVGDIVEFRGVFQDTLLISLCAQPDGYLKKDNILTPTMHLHEPGTN